jgi:hypothetical protein
MLGFRLNWQAPSSRACNRLALALFVAGTVVVTAQSDSAPAAPVWNPLPAAETVQYGIDWRLIPAGTALVRLKRDNDRSYTAEVRLESSGLLDKLFRVRDVYQAGYDGGAGFCAVQSVMDASEGKRHRETKLTFDRAQGKAASVERDLVNGGKVVKSSEVDVPACVHDVVGGLFALRQLHLEPGQSTTVPLSDGKKTVMAKVEAQEWEELKTKAGTFKTMRYEAFVFDNVLYQRSARLYVWVTDDARRLVVQIRLKMQFTIGTVTLTMEKIGELPPAVEANKRFASALREKP